jgi:hypothetical protein
MTAVSIASFASALSRGASIARSHAIVTLFACFAVLVMAGRWCTLFGKGRNRALLPVALGTLVTLPIALAVPWLRSALGLGALSRTQFLIAAALAAAFGILERLLGTRWPRNRNGDPIAVRPESVFGI